MSGIAQKLLMAAGGQGGTDMFTVLDTEELVFDMGKNGNVTQSITMSYDDPSELEFRILEKGTGNTALSMNTTHMITPGSTSHSVTRVPNTAAQDRNQLVTFNTSTNTVRVITGTGSNSFRGSVQIIRYARTVAQTITLLNNGSTLEQTMPATVSDLSKCFLQKQFGVPGGVYVKGPLNNANTNSFHNVFNRATQENGGVAITSNSTYRCQTTATGTHFLIEFE